MPYVDPAVVPPTAPAVGTPSAPTVPSESAGGTAGGMVDPVGLPYAYRFVVSQWGVKCFFRHVYELEKHTEQCQNISTKQLLYQVFDIQCQVQCTEAPITPRNKAFVLAFKPPSATH